MAIPKSRRKRAPANPLHPQHLSDELAKLSAPSEDKRPTAFVIVGPNGSGKSTIFEVMRQDAGPMLFINADLIGKVFANAPEPEVLAQKFADTFRDHVLSHPTTFATETVFSDPVGAKLAWLRKAAATYRVVLIVVGLESAKLSMARVRARVANGGHPVPIDKLARRYESCMANCRDALKFVEVGLVFENSLDLGAQSFRPMAHTANGRVVWQAKEVPDHIQNLLPADAPPSARKPAKKRAKASTG